MYPPVTSPVLGLLGLILVVMFAFVEIGVIEVVYARLGISHRAITSLLMLTLLGSYINLPLMTIHSHPVIENRVISVFGIPYVVPHIVEANRTLIAINLGGALIPIALSIYLVARFRFFSRAAVATVVVALVVYHFSRLVPGVGIAVPTIVPGVLAAVISYLLDRQRAPALAYIAGTLGCLLGADIFNLGRLSAIGAPVASIGGAGTFDGVFISGVVAVLLA